MTRLPTQSTKASMECRIPESPLPEADSLSSPRLCSFPSSSSDTSSSLFVILPSRGSSWGGLRVGLRGGGDNSLSNGTSGWGPPPGASGGGWGAPGSGSVGPAWGAPGPSHGSSSSAPAPPAGHEDALASAMKAVPPMSHPSSPPGASAAQHANNGSGTGSSSSGASSTSWAAAAGKGLPPSENPVGGVPSSLSSAVVPPAVSAPLPTSSASVSSNSASTKQQLEQLNSVREALFSQDGWGGSFVKQDTSWDTSLLLESSPHGASGPSPASASSLASPGHPLKEQAPSASHAPSSTFSTHNGRRNDGTDIWKVNLSGQPPAPKPPVVPNPWGHSPQNPTDFKNWGEEEEERLPTVVSGPAVGPSDGPRAAESLWRGRPEPPHIHPHHPHHPHPPHPHHPHIHNSHPTGIPQPSGAPSSSFGGSSSKDDWAPVVGPTGSWSDRREPSQSNPPPPPPSSNLPVPPRGDASGWNGSAGPPLRQVMNQWGGTGAPSNFMRGGWGPNNDGDSPTLSRRPVSHAGMDDGGTSLWGKIPPGPPVSGDRHDRGNWQDMPTPSPAARGGPPGPPSRLGMPNPAPTVVKDPSPWGAPIGHRGWGEDPPMKPSGWGGMDGMMDGPRDNGWGGASEQWPNRGPPRGPGNSSSSNSNQIRVSPNWDDSNEPWGGQIKRGLTKEFIWSSKQFRMLVEMGFDKNEAENALRRSHLNLEDAMDYLRYNRGKEGGPLFNDPFDPMRGRFPPSQMFNYSSNAPSGNALDHPSSGSSSSSYAPNFMMHNSGGGSAGLKMNNGSSGPLNGGVSNLRHHPPSSSGSASNPAAASNNQAPPSAQQLRILVQQIQMAVQAGHLNPQILNQPLAPQTLILLNQLLQQIKNLQTLQLAQSQKSVNPQMPGALLVNITKTKQTILNLQNQISAQQANYLKAQTAAPMSNSSSSNSQLEMSTMQDMFAGLGLNNGGGGGNALDASVINNNNGSRLAQWKLNEDSLSKAPGSKLPSSSSANLLLDDGPWSNSAPGGWPDKQSGVDVANTSSSVPPCSVSASAPNGSAGLDHFGISEFEPGKPWKGPGLKNPDDDPSLTPGSVAPSVLQMDVVKVSASSSSTAVDNNSSSAAALGLTTPTWTSYSNKSEGVSSSKVPSSEAASSSSAWGAQPQGSSSSLTPMGQDLWGKAGRSGPPGLVNSSNGPEAGGKAWNSPEGGPPAWLLLKNLTAQIDGATLKTLCLQHGPLKHFHLYLNHNLALVNYNSSREAVKAQNALNNCLLGNTTIMATFASDGEVNQILKQQHHHQQGGGGGSNVSPSSAPPPNSNPVVTSDNNRGGSTPSSGGELWGPIKPSSRAPGEGSVWGNPLGSAGDDQHRILLPGDLGI